MPLKLIIGARSYAEINFQKHNFTQIDTKYGLDADSNEFTRRVA